jgi:hypothetical protein
LTSPEPKSCEERGDQKEKVRKEDGATEDAAYDGIALEPVEARETE